MGNVGDRTVMLTHDVSGGGSIDIWLYKVHPDGRALPVSIDRIRYMN